MVPSTFAYEKMPLLDPNNSKFIELGLGKTFFRGFRLCPTQTGRTIQPQKMARG